MTQRTKVEPFVRGTLHRSVVKIESVDIDVNFGHWIQSLPDGIRPNKDIVDFRPTESNGP
jgi:hypothetical protein